MRETHMPSMRIEDMTAPPPEDLSYFYWFKWDLTPSEWDIVLVSSCIKLLLFPA
jgi:alpha-1,3-glucosyltransferase